MPKGSGSRPAFGSRAERLSGIPRNGYIYRGRTPVIDRPFNGGAVNVAVQLEPAAEKAPSVQYRWDADTEVLTARLDGVAANGGMSGSVVIEGSDGSWLILEVAAGRINGVEVAVWPDVHKRPALVPPSTVEDALVVIPSRASQPGIASLEVDTPLMAEADASKRVIHFRVGARREVRTVRIGTDLLLDVDTQSRVAGLWMLNVPPSPST